MAELAKRTGGQKCPHSVLRATRVEPKTEQPNNRKLKTARFARPLRMLHHDHRQVIVLAGVIGEVVHFIQHLSDNCFGGAVAVGE